MPNDDDRHNWFEQGGDDYARFRPDYPAGLASFLASVAPGRRQALDVGCGSGQLTHQLADSFDAVIAIDASREQIAHAPPHPRVRYEVAPAERLPCADGSTDLIVAAQAAHWFDLPRFYAEVRRASAPGAAIALVSYGVMEMDADLRERFATFYTDEIGPYWPPERRLVDTGYADLDFPFAELAHPPFQIDRHWSIRQFFGYLSTWSATRQARANGADAVLADFSRDMLGLWGAPDRLRTIRWPITMRLGRVG